MENTATQKPKFFPFEKDGQRFEYETMTDIVYRLTTKIEKTKRSLDGQVVTREVTTGLELIPIGENGEPLIEISGNGIKHASKGYVIYPGAAPLSAGFGITDRKRRYIGYSRN